MDTNANSHRMNTIQDILVPSEPDHTSRRLYFHKDTSELSDVEFK